MEIATERLTLRPFKVDDIDSAFGVLGDERTMSYYRQPYSREEVERILKKNIETFEKWGYGLFAVIEQSSDHFIGDCGITIQIIDGVEEFEIGYRIGRYYWGLGYGPEAAKAIRDYGFNRLGLKKLCSYMPSDHTQSRRVAEKIGMKFEKEFRNPRNRDLPTTVYSIYNQAVPLL
jgi:RimJ/RimL family protein N-acetyltransferase